MNVKTQLSRSPTWQALGCFCGIMMSLTSPVHAQTRSPLGAVLTVRASDFTTILSHNDPTRVFVLHYNTDFRTLSFIPSGSSVETDILIRLPRALLDPIRNINYTAAIREVTPGSEPTTVAVTPWNGGYVSGSGGTGFYLIPLQNWQAFTTANGGKLPSWLNYVRLPIRNLTEDMVLVAYDPPFAQAIVLTGGGFDWRPINTGTATDPNNRVLPVRTLIPNLDAPPPTGPSFRLTSNEPGQVGAVWFPNKQYVAGGFLSTFQFQMTGMGAVRSNIEPGADGFAFVIQNYSLSLPRFLGGYLGYHGIPNSLAIEFDTYWNREFGFFDPDGNHISVHTQGIYPNTVDERASVGRTSAVPLLNDGAPHLVQILYQPGTLSLFVDNLQYPALVVRGIDFTRFLRLDAGHAWLGFTAGTGAAFQNHDILNWDFRVLSSSIQN
jgi:hypothetical protein